jgi:hypothetical protein
MYPQPRSWRKFASAAVTRIFVFERVKIGLIEKLKRFLSNFKSFILLDCYKEQK